jgi:ATP-dependent RNA helicase DeaD
MLFSATISKEIEKLSRKYLNDPVNVSLESSVKPEFLRQTYYLTTPEQKIPLLIHLLKSERDLALVFCNRKRITEVLAKKLSAQGVHAKCLHGDMSQNQREKVTDDFRHKRINILIATDVASRGLHIEDISHVYNYEIPKDVDSYTHRVGRTARAGKKGEAISLVAGPEEQKFFKQILFTHQGIITLKNIDAFSIAKIEPAVHQPKKKQSAQFHGKRGREFEGNKKQNKSRGWRNR